MPYLHTPLKSIWKFRHDTVLDNSRFLEIQARRIIAPCNSYKPFVLFIRLLKFRYPFISYKHRLTLSFPHPQIIKQPSDSFLLLGSFSFNFLVLFYFFYSNVFPAFAALLLHCHWFTLFFQELKLSCVCVCVCVFFFFNFCVPKYLLPLHNTFTSNYNYNSYMYIFFFHI
jgi:hypothetical protein